MIQIKIFNSESELNDWLREERKNITVKDIKLQCFTSVDGLADMLLMVIYWDLREVKRK